MVGRKLPVSFYIRENVLLIAKELLGKVLVTTCNGVYTSAIIVETEAYRAPDDKACHAYQNRRTARTETMFAKGGCSYVYICYGIHHLFNVVTSVDGDAHAVLIRAVQPLEGVEHMLKRRNFLKPDKELTNGPGKFTRAMGIYREHDMTSLISDSSPIWIEDRGDILDDAEIITGPRVGMRTAGDCSNWPWRYRIKENRWTSKPDRVWYDL